MKKLTTAFSILRDHGFNTLLSTVIEKLQNNSRSSLLRIPIFLLHQLLFLFDEGAIALPSDRNWRIVSLPFCRFDRFLPALTVVPGSHHGSSRHVEIMGEIYTCKNFVELEPGDIVVDVGAYVGGFSRFAARRADQVICVEPAAAENDVLETNLRDLSNVTIVPGVAWNRRETLEVNRSSSPNENSLLTPDTGAMASSFTVQGDTVPNVVRELGYEHIDYLKIEAEGVETEILQGALEGETEIDRIAVDASPEGGSETTMDDVKDLLEAHGYRTQVKDREKWWQQFILFGTRSR